jgi:dienelactone hydrolase
MEVTVEAAGVRLAGTYRSPAAPRGCIVFAHGSGSSRQSPRNIRVAESLAGRRFATLLFDLLTAEEEALDARTGELRFDITLLAQRLIGALDWFDAFDPSDASDASDRPDGPDRPDRESAGPGSPLPVGLFGASTGAAAALVAAAERPSVVRAVVSRGGRPDLAGEALAAVRAPTLLIVGERDATVLDLNRAAATRLAAPHEIAVVPGATHLFAEPGALDHVARLAGEWFERHLGP